MLSFCIGNHNNCMKKQRVKNPKKDKPKKSVKGPGKKKDGLNMKNGKLIPVTSPEYRRKRHDPKEALKNYKLVHTNRKPKDEIEETTLYRKGRIVKMEYHPATWSLVLTFAVINAVMVFCTKVVIFEEIGKPSLGTLTPSDEELVHK